MTTRRGRRRLMILMTAALAPLSGLHAQSTKAELFGIVRDPSGLPVNGASVELINTGTEARSSAETDVDGSYRFFALSSGSYKISAARQGFATLQRDGIVLRVGDQISLDLRLTVG